MKYKKGLEMPASRKTDNITPEQLTQQLGGHNYNGNIMIMRITPSNADLLQEKEDSRSVIRFDMICTFLVLGGSAVISLDFVDYNIKENCMVLPPPNTTIILREASDDFDCLLFIANRTFMADLIANHRSIPSINIINMEIERVPIIQLSKRDVLPVKRAFSGIYFFLKGSEDPPYKELKLSASIYILIIELISAINNNINYINKENEKGNITRRKREIFTKFMLLLRTNEEPQMLTAEYCAQKLRISVQYLSLVLKLITGNTTTKWIINERLIRAKTMLKTPNTTIKQIAERLGFADQSSFGKFFKKYTGTSPKKYAGR